MNTSLLEYKDSIIQYKICGNGPIALIAFHGFDQDCSAFDFLISDSFKNKYTLYSTSLYFHGSDYKKKFRSNTAIELTELIETVLSLCEKEHIQTFDLIGYSIGGRLALALTNEIPERIKNIYLIAPDGIVINKWYWFSTQTIIGRQIFFRSNLLTQLIAMMSNLAFRIRLVSITEMKAFRYALSQKNGLQKVMQTWLIYRKIRVPKKWGTKINSGEVKAHFYYGEYDKLIDVKSVSAVRRTLDNPERIVILNSGHNLLQKKFSETYLNDLLD